MVLEISQSMGLFLTAGAVAGAILAYGIRIGHNDTKYATKVELEKCRLKCDHANKNLVERDEAVDVKNSNDLAKHSAENMRMFEKITSDIGEKIDAISREQQVLKIQITRIETKLQEGE